MENSQSDPPNVSAAQEAQVVVEPEPASIAAVQSITVSDQLEFVPSQAPADALVSHAQVVTKDESLGQNQETPGVASPSEAEEGENKPSTPQSTPSTSPGQNYVPPTKRFKAVNINNKFLKTQNTASTAVGSAASSSSKQTNAIARPTPQTTQSHSRLVTTKLTATPLSSQGTGWTRPSSVTPPAPSPGTPTGQSKGTLTLTTVGGHGPPQIAPGGKIIQPQVLKQKVEGAARPAWRSVQPGASSVSAQGDFPTAAEAAQTRALRNAEVKAAVMAVEAQKQAMSETADAFRGVHLDPNAHHWDEVDDDNDDFLGGVIEFGDGRQYTIEVTEGAVKGPNAPEGPRDIPVSKADRFADDYDRSWPKTRGSEQGHPHDGHGRQNWASQSETSSNAPHSPVSMRDGHQSKLLFNERSNRMEPFSGKQHASSTHAPPHIASRKASHDSSTSSRFNHSRFERDPPPHANIAHEDNQGSLRARGVPISHPNGINDRQSRQDWNAHSRHANDVPSTARDPSVSRSSVHDGHSVTGGDVAGRHGNAWGVQRHGPTREIPPHLEQAQSRSPLVETRDLKPASETSPQSPRSNLPSIAPNAAQGPVVRPSPADPPPVVPSPEELASLRKAFLADNAEKAKRRRQEEEEERTKAQERAKEKAAKLAALMEASKPNNSRPSPEVRTKELSKAQASDAQVLDIIEEAVKSVTEPRVDAGSKQSSANGRSMARRLSSARSVDHQPTPTSPVSSTHPRPAAEPPVSERADSWRSTARPKAAIATSETVTGENRQTTVHATLPEVRAFEFEAESHTEILDFSEMGSLSKDTPASTRPGRPVASDYFTGTPPKSYSAVAEGRVQASVTDSQAHVASPSSNSQVMLTPTGVKSLRVPNANFKEAPLSTLDDTMSRIKGALDGMHIHDEAGLGDSARAAPHVTTTSHTALTPTQSSNAAPPRLNKWLPPALRPQGSDFRHRRTEDFTNTSCDPPMDPFNGSPIARLPKTCKYVSLIPKKQLMAFRTFNGPVRWDILSFDPPVEGMTKKSLLVNDVLFRKPVGPYKQRKYRVHFPRRRYSPRQRERELKSVNKEQPQESARETAAGAFGRSKVNESAPWRSPEINTVQEVRTEELQEVRATSSLNVTSRSPPPDVPSVKAGEKITSERTPDASTVPLQATSSLESTSFVVRKDDPVIVSSRPAGIIGQSPKRVVSEGSAKIETYVETKVSFTPRGVSKPLPGSATISPSFRKLELSHLEASGETIASMSSAPTHTATPPPQPSASTWAKSPARVPDPEHLKAVWSQPPSKGPLPSVNSLKSIADDLTSVPFTLHEVKSESGTPPPTSSGSSVAHPSRMTASEVTRAFQTVPTAPANSAPTPSSRPAHLPPNASSPIVSERSLKAGVPPPAMYPSPGQAYYYATSANNHSPSPPTVIYPHVVQNGVTASPASPYAQPVWMPVVQQPGQQMLRPQPPSPYSPQMIPYQTTGPQNGMMRPPTNGLVPNAAGAPGTYGSPAPGQMLVSPVMHHATPAQPMVYPGSPMLVHVTGPAPGSVAPHPPQRPYPQGVVGVGRGGIPVNSQYSHQPQVQTHAHPQAMHPAAHHTHVRYPAPNPGYNAAPIPHAYMPQHW